ncbi:hypothetical protein [Chondromyces apiculatus]|uniref:Uncharacterized protein n=1 Tax=Chondromyces apiculatus DSM 436 TaxID=1192034 RepID=A0A017SVT3_9BACT|nr:hypothetical protein [Chondromyces apiculatus]EYF01073.1 Hypothetical protein CAP_8730 [Chondromyces apiculatus DSM 436]
MAAAQRRDSAPPPVVLPGENPALDAALARLRQERVGSAAVDAGLKASSTGAVASGGAASTEVALPFVNGGTLGTALAQPATRVPATRLPAAGEARRGAASRGATGWWVVGLSSLAIVGTVVVMTLAVLGGRGEAKVPSSATADGHPMATAQDAPPPGSASALTPSALPASPAPAASAALPAPLPSAHASSAPAFSTGASSSSLRASTAVPRGTGEPSRTQLPQPRVRF